MRRPYHFYDGHAEDASSLVNLTPLLDVLFVVLILFILIAPLIELDKVQLSSSEIPKEQKQSNSLQSKDPIVILVNENNDIFLNKTPILLGDLKYRLATYKQQYPNAIPKLYHDKKAYFDNYQRIKNTLETVGFKEMDVILQSK